MIYLFIIWKGKKLYIKIDSNNIYGINLFYELNFTIKEKTFLDISRNYIDIDESKNSKEKNK